MEAMEEQEGGEHTSEHTAKTGFSLFGEALRDPATRRALSVGCMLQAVQQLTGINTVMYYCGTILVMAGFTDPSKAIWLTAAVSFVGFAFTNVGVLVVDRLGRRKLTLGSLAGVVGSLVLLGGGFYYSKLTSQHVLGGTGACSHYTSCYDCVLDSNCVFCSPGGNDSSTAAGFCVTANISGAGRNKVGPDAASMLVCSTGILPAPPNKSYLGMPRPSLPAHHHPAAVIRLPTLAWTETTAYRQRHPLAAPPGNGSGNGSAGGRNHSGWAEFNMANDTCPGANNGGKFSLGATALYLAFFQPGMGPMPWTINSEIYPLHLRSMGVSIATMVNWGGNLVISYTFLDLTQAVTTYGAFWIYAAIGVLGWFYFYAALPETANKSLEEIQELFKRR